MFSGQCLCSVPRLWGYTISASKPFNRNINTDMHRMWTIIPQRTVAGRVLLSKGLSAAWLLALEGPGWGPVRWRDTLATHDPDSSPGWGVIYPSVLASDNLPLIKGQSLSGRAEWRGRDRRPPCLRHWHPDRHSNGVSRRCERHMYCTPTIDTRALMHIITSGHIHRNVHVVIISTLLCMTYTHFNPHTHTKAKIKTYWVGLDFLWTWQQKDVVNPSRPLFDLSLWTVKDQCSWCSGFTNRLPPQSISAEIVSIVCVWEKNDPKYFFMHSLFLEISSCLHLGIILIFVFVWGFSLLSSCMKAVNWVLIGNIISSVYL